MPQNQTSTFGISSGKFGVFIIRNWLYRFFDTYEEIIRLFSMSFILTPAASLLPRHWAMMLADALALLLLISPQVGRKTYNEMRRAFGKGRLETFHLTWKWLSRPFRDFAFLKSVQYKRDDKAQWTVIEKNCEAVQVLKESKKSYIVASGHFTREAIGGMFSPKVTSGHPVQVAQSLPDPVRSIRDKRILVQFGAMIHNLSYWGRETELIFCGDSSFRKLVTRLKEPGNVVFIHIDAPWFGNERSSFSRPFTGYKNRPFSVGTARLARLVQCPIVSCVYSIEKDRTMVLEYGTPIFPEHGNDDKSEIQIMDQLLNHLETAIGERPTQYVLSIGGERRWNPVDRRWEDLPS